MQDEWRLMAINKEMHSELNEWAHDLLDYDSSLPVISLYFSQYFFIIWFSVQWNTERKHE